VRAGVSRESLKMRPKGSFVLHVSGACGNKKPASLISDLAG